MADFLFIKSIILGFSIAAPVGPIGVLCIQRSLSRGFVGGFVTGLGAATADAIFGALAAFGLTLITGFLMAQAGWLNVGGGLFLCYLGWRTFTSRPAPTGAIPATRSIAGAYLSTLLLTLTNPLTILSFTLMFSALGGEAFGGGQGAAAMMVLGVFLGSGLWWLLLSSGVDLLRHRLTGDKLGWINRLAGLVIAAFGLAVLASNLA